MKWRTEWSGRSFLGPKSALSEKKVPVDVFRSLLYTPVRPINFFVLVSELRNEVATAKICQGLMLEHQKILTDLKLAQFFDKDEYFRLGSNW